MRQRFVRPPQRSIAVRPNQSSDDATHPVTFNVVVDFIDIFPLSVADTSNVRFESNCVKILFV